MWEERIQEGLGAVSEGRPRIRTCLKVLRQLEGSEEAGVVEKSDGRAR